MHADLAGPSLSRLAVSPPDEATIWSMLVDLLPAALGVASSPVPVIAVVLMLSTARARVTAPLFACGWLGGLTLVCVVVLAVGGDGRRGDLGLSALVDWLSLVLGAALILLASATWWSRRPRAARSGRRPAWMASIDAMSPGRAALLGLGLSSVNPKNLALAVIAAASVARSDSTTAQSAVAVALFVLLGSVTVAGPTVWFMVSPQRALRPLSRLEAFMAARGTLVLAVALALIGAKLLVDGLRGLAA